jgi:uncharacterized protein (TIGR00251 family)
MPTIPDGTVAVKVVPSASRDACAGLMDDGCTWRLRIAAPPVDGKANEAVVRFLAALLRLPASAISIQRGQTSRRKVLRIAGVTEQQVHDCLAKASE